MSIEVHSPHVVNNLVADAERRTLRAFPPPNRSRSAAQSGTVPLTRTNTLPIAASAHQNTTLSKLTTEDIEKECYKQLLCNKRLYRELTNTEHTFVKSLEVMLDESRNRQKYKYGVLFSKWEDKVFNKVQEDIDSQLSSGRAKKLDSQKRRLFSRYLDTCNAKGTVFLDIISNEEYDPLCLANRNFSTTIPSSKDPTKLIQNEDRTSASIERECGVKSGTQQSVRRSDTRGSCNEWIRLPIRDVDSTIRQRTRQRMINKTVCSEPAKNELNLPKRKHAQPSYSLHRPLSQMFY